MNHTYIQTQLWLSNSHPYIYYIAAGTGPVGLATARLFSAEVET